VACQLPIYTYLYASLSVGYFDKSGADKKGPLFIELGG